MITDVVVAAGRLEYVGGLKQGKIVESFIL